MRATAEPVEGNLVRLSIEVDEPEVDRVLDEAVRSLSRQLRVPGFRPGKVPRQVLEARMGGAVALRVEALREAMPDFYARAVADTEVDPIAPPDIDITSGEDGGPVAFDATVQVRPVVPIPGYEGLQVTVPSPAVREEDVDAQVDRLRENEGELVAAGRPAADSDHVTIDVHAKDASGNEVVGADDFLYEVGSGSVVPQLDDELRGASEGAILAFTATPPDNASLEFRVLVKDVQRKQLPDATDEWAAETSEFETMAQLRDDITARMTKVKLIQSQMTLRENALAALVELVDDDPIPQLLVDEEVQQRVHDLSHRLEQQRISIEQFLEATGRNGDELLGELRTEAERTVKADLALRSLADAEGLTVSEQDLADEIGEMAARMEMGAGELRTQLERAGRTAAVRSEQRKAKALTWLLDHVEMVDEDGAPLTRDDLTLDETPCTGDAGAEANVGAAETIAADEEPMTEESE